MQGQNRDYAERAVDDAKRLAIQDEAIERLEHSVQAYQDERTRLEAAYQQLASNLGAASDPQTDRQSRRRSLAKCGRATASARRRPPAASKNSQRRWTQAVAALILAASSMLRRAALD